MDMRNPHIYYKGDHLSTKIANVMNMRNPHIYYKGDHLSTKIANVHYKTDFN